MGNKKNKVRPAKKRHYKNLAANMLDVIKRKREALAQGLPWPEAPTTSAASGSNVQQTQEHPSEYEKDVEKYVEVIELSEVKQEPVDLPDEDSQVGYNPLGAEAFHRQPVLTVDATAASASAAVYNTGNTSNTITLYPPENAGSSSAIIRPVPAQKRKLTGVDIKKRCLQAKRSDQEILLTEIERLKAKVTELTTQITHLVNKKTDNFDDFGGYIASKLRNMPLVAATNLERKLLEVVISCNFKEVEKERPSAAVNNSFKPPSSSQDHCIDFQVFSQQQQHDT